jgi:hypothetical protein
MTRQQGTSRCSKCKAKTHLELIFDFGFGQYPHHCKVLDVFLPKHIDRWQQGNFRRSFYPFLVIVKAISDRRGNSMWLPYWHIDKNRHRTLYKYGQWASFIGSTPFVSLVRQARAKGYRI